MTLYQTSLIGLEIRKLDLGLNHCQKQIMASRICCNVLDFGEDMAQAMRLLKFVMTRPQILKLQERGMPLQLIKIKISPARIRLR